MCRPPVSRDALPIMADVVLRPTFQDTELKRVRKERLNVVAEAQDDPEQLIRIRVPAPALRRDGSLRHQHHRHVVVAAAIDGGRSEGVPRCSVPAVQRGAGRHRRRDDRDIALPLLDQAFGGWTGAAPAATMSPRRPSAATTRRVFLIDKPAPRSRRSGSAAIGVARSTPDYFALRVLNTILGGAFTSRLNANLREQHGYAYGASSHVRHAPGRRSVLCGRRRADRQDGRSAEGILRRAEPHPRAVPREELEKAANYLALLLPRNFETISSVATSVSQLYVYSLADDFYATYADRVRAVTPADVKRVADKYIVPEKLDRRSRRRPQDDRVGHPRAEPGTAHDCGSREAMK